MDLYIAHDYAILLLSLDFYIHDRVGDRFFVILHELTLVMIMILFGSSGLLSYSGIWTVSIEHSHYDCHAPAAHVMYTGGLAPAVVFFTGRVVCSARESQIAPSVSRHEILKAVYFFLKKIRVENKFSRRGQIRHEHRKLNISPQTARLL